MAKKKIKNVVSEQHLEKLNAQQLALNELINRIGAMEAEKHSMLHRIAEVNRTVEEFKLELEETYGAVTIDLATGEYKPIENKDNAVKHQKN